MRKPAARRRFFSQCTCCEPAGAGFDRRRFLASGAAALGIAAGIRPAPAQSQAKRRIDVHHHIVPPVHAEALRSHTASTWLGTYTVARECNEYAAKLAQDHPGRFRSFADIILPDTEGALREIEYSLDTLKAEGIALWTSYDGKYLGDPAFVPVFEELNRRKAVVYTHPTVPNCCNNLVKGVGVSSLEYNHDTTRTIASVVFGEGKIALRFPDIKFIWSHSGGTLPFLTSRMEQVAKSRKDEFPNGANPVFRKFFYEVAQGNTHAMLAGLFDMVPVSQVMFGSDYPYREAIEAAQGLANYKLSEADLRAIEYENAQRVMPALKTI